MSPKPVDLEALSALEAKATPGDWSDDPRGGGVVRGPKLYEYARGSGQRQLASFMLHDDLPPEEREANAALIIALRNAAPAMIQELRELRASRVPPEREELLLAAMDAATARAERDALRAEVEGLKAQLATAREVLRLFEEGRRMFVDGLDDRAQDRFEQAADTLKKTRGGMP